MEQNQLLVFASFLSRIPHQMLYDLQSVYKRDLFLTLQPSFVGLS